MTIKLQEPISSGSLRATNFFNGRLVTSADLTREQTARREAARRLGQASGQGVVYGLEVEKDFGSVNAPIVEVNAGLAVNACGQTLFLSQKTSVNLLERLGAPAAASTIFSQCQPFQGGTYTAVDGIYLLVLSPAESTEGSAPTSGLNNAFSTCNTDVILETVQFRLLAVDPFVRNETPADQKLLRNFLAYRCFGVAETKKFFADPLGFSVKNYGLIDEMAENLLSDSDVPLAIINWTSAGIQFVEMWAVRRKLHRQSDAEDWRQLLGGRRIAETEAMILQFAEHIEQILLETANPTTIEAEDFFEFLPPAGILPVSRSGSAVKGFDAQEFFGDKAGSEIVSMDGDRLRPLLCEALKHEPIDLATNDKVQLYHIRENLQAIDDGENVRKVVVFARHSLPYCGVARFDEAVYDADKFAEFI